MQLKERASEMAGCPLVFELVDFAREFLTERNRPVGPCPICLVSLEKEFCKTPCFHYFHSYCLGKALESQRDDKEEGKPFICPVCRESLGSSMDVEKLLLAPDPASFSEDDNDDGGGEDRAVCEDVKKVLCDWKRQQRRFKSVYERQLRKGGIIDLEEEAKRCLVSLRVSNNDGEDGGTTAVTQRPASPSQTTPRPTTAEKTNGSTAATKESSSTNNAKGKGKDEEAGTRQRYKRQPKSRYSHHRQINKSKASASGNQPQDS